MITFSFENNLRGARTQHSYTAVQNDGSDDVARGALESTYQLLGSVFFENEETVSNATQVLSDKFHFFQKLKMFINGETVLC